MGLAVEIIGLIFGSLIAVAAIVSLGVMVATDKITLPGSAIRRVKKAAADLEVTKYRENQMIIEMRMDAHQEQRLDRALNPPKSNE